MYDDTDKEVSGRISLLAEGEKQERPAGVPTPCHICPKVPPSRQTAAATYRDAIEPTERSRAILAHYHRCRAVGRFPEDALVEENAGLIREVEVAVDGARHHHAAGLLALLVPSKVGV